MEAKYSSNHQKREEVSTAERSYFSICAEKFEVINKIQDTKKIKKYRKESIQRTVSLVISSKDSLSGNK